MDRVTQIEHNAEVYYKNKDNEKKYETRASYDDYSYHRHDNYKKTNKAAKEQKEQGLLKDAYTGDIFKQNAKTDLDHIVSAKEIHLRVTKRCNNNTDKYLLNNSKTYSKNHKTKLCLICRGSQNSMP